MKRGERKKNAMRISMSNSSITNCSGFLVKILCIFSSFICLFLIVLSLHFIFCFCNIGISVVIFFFSVYFSGDSGNDVFSLSSLIIWSMAKAWFNRKTRKKNIFSFMVAFENKKFKFRVLSIFVAILIELQFQFMRELYSFFRFRFFFFLYLFLLLLFPIFGWKCEKLKFKYEA